MAASNQIITDITLVISNGPSATTTANAIAAAGPIQDYPGNTKLALLKFQEASVLLAKVIINTDSTDSANLTLLQGVQAALLHTASPSAALLADMATVYLNGPNSATQAKSIAAAGVIMDYPGNVHTIRRKLQEARVQIVSLVSITDAGTDSANKTLLQNIDLALV